MKILVYIFIIAIFFSGCAKVTFYSDEELKKETGLKYFEAKPYLLVTHKAKDQVETQLIYLPDKSQPQYAVFTPGLGSHEFSVGVANGILTSYGQKSDTKIPELILAMTGLISEGVKSAATAGLFPLQAAPNYRELAEDVSGIASNLDTGMKDIKLSDAEKSLDKIVKTVNKLNEASQDLIKPVPNIKEVVIPSLKESRGNLELLIRQVPEKAASDTPTSRYNALLNTQIKRIDAVITKIIGEPPPGAAFELYEIIQIDGKPAIRRVGQQ